MEAAAPDENLKGALALARRHHFSNGSSIPSLKTAVAGGKERLIKILGCLRPLNDLPGLHRTGSHSPSTSAVTRESTTWHSGQSLFPRSRGRETGKWTNGQTNPTLRKKHSRQPVEILS